jgi:hypothetical protein
MGGLGTKWNDTARPLKAITTISTARLRSADNLFAHALTAIPRPLNNRRQCVPCNTDDTRAPSNNRRAQRNAMIDWGWFDLTGAGHAKIIERAIITSGHGPDANPAEI